MVTEAAGQEFLLTTIINICFNMKGWSLIGKVKSHSEGRRRSVEVGTRLGAGVEAEGVVAELVSPCRSSSKPTRLSGSLS